MAKCCSQDVCSCLIHSGDGITVTGSGSPTDPYVVTANFPDFSQSLTVTDTNTLNLSLRGSGTPQDPFALQGDVVMALVDLSDVQDIGGPAAGDVPLWVGSTATGHFEFGPPPANPAGSVNVSVGLSGTGAAATPIEVNVSGVWGVAPLDAFGPDSTVGLEVYVDSANKLRARPVEQGPVTWDTVLDKPTTFPPTLPINSTGVSNQLAMDVGKINGHPVYFQKAEDPTWPNGTVWGSWT